MTRNANRNCLSAFLGAALILMLPAIVFAPLSFAQAQTFKVPYNFTGTADGGNPVAGLVRDSEGDVYGTTVLGGNASCAIPMGCGVVFKLDPTGYETALYNFTGGSDGGYPQAGLILDAAGNLYGTTAYGGDLNCEAPYGCGVVFMWDKKETKEIVLHAFSGAPDGLYPLGGLIRDDEGNLYGTTSGGGSANVGVIFRLDSSGNETILHSFAGAPSDGAFPTLTSLLGSGGALYGVTQEGGTSNAGVVYKLSKAGTGARLTVLHSFALGYADGQYPWGTPIMDKGGSLYGTAYMGGSAANGIVWRVSPSGKETVLHNFYGYPADGAQPNAGVITDGKGNLYGTTAEGGTNGEGTVYELNSEGSVTLLHSFLSSSDGGYPKDGLIFDPAGNLYGTTYEGGSYDYGTVFELTP